MMRSLPLKKLRSLGMFSLIAAVAVSCGSYQQSSYYDNDGIYSNENRQVGVERPVRRPATNQRPVQRQDDAYSQYFGQQAGQFEQILDNEIFTDVDSYSSGIENDSLTSVNLTDYYQSDNDYAGQAGWGENANNVNINIIDTGFGFNSPWLYNGWNNWGWGGFGGFSGPWGFNRWNRWNNWGWGGGFGYAGFGWGGFGNGWGAFGNPWFCPPGYYGYGGFYGNGYGYSRRNIAFNNGRRGYYNNVITNTNSRAIASRGRSNINTSRGNSSRYRNSSNTARNSTARSTRSNRNGIASRRAVGVDRNRTYRSSRSTRAVPRYNSSSRSNQTYRNTAPRSSTYQRGSSSSVRTRSATPRTSTYRRSNGSRTNSSTRTNQSYRNSTPRSSGYRSSSPSRGSSRSSGSYRSSSSSRSSGSVRSSGGSSRSSSGRSSGGRSSGRRQ